MNKSKNSKRCYVCGDRYNPNLGEPNDNDWGPKYGKGGWRTCGPVCRYFDMMRMI